MAGVSLLVARLAVSEDSRAYRDSILKWRSEREARLKAEDGWLSLAGLHWLRPGENHFGSDPSNAIVVPRPAPARAGVFDLSGDRVTLRVSADDSVKCNGKPVRELALKSDSDGGPDIVETGGIKMYVIRRGTRFGIRVKDNNGPFRTSFVGLEWFPVNPALRVEARLVPFDPPRKMNVPDVTGGTQEFTAPGYAVFRLESREIRLEPALSGDQLYFIFRDRTSGKETYPAGRYLYTDLPKDGKVILDFNKAYNPPCAFTPYATCPLPPRQNSVPVAIRAGELNYHYDESLLRSP